MSLTTSYASISNVNSVSDVQVIVSDMTFKTKYITNSTHGFLLVDLPCSVGLCDLISVHAPTLDCSRRDVVDGSEMRAKLDDRFIRRAFGTPSFTYHDKNALTNLLASGTYDYPFLVQSFPSLAVKLQAPVQLHTSEECGAVNCTTPRVTDFFVDGARDTLIYGGVYLGTKYLIELYVLPAVKRALTPVLGPPLRFLKKPFVTWYNKAIYAADSVSARAFDSGMSAVARSAATSSADVELARLLPVVTASGSLKGLSPPRSPVFTPGSSLFRTPIGSSSSVSVMVGSVPNLVASSRYAGVSGLARSAGSIKYYSAPALPTLGRGTEVLTSLSRSTFDNLVQVPTSNTNAGKTITINVVKSNSRSVLANLFKAVKLIPKRRKREVGPISIKVATSLRSAGRLLSRIPSWVGHAVGVGLPWVLSGVQHLRTLDETITTIFPIQRLSSYERYFIAMTTLLSAQCYHDRVLRKKVLDSNDFSNETISIGSRVFGPADVLFDLRLGLAGDTLRECVPFFSGQIMGIDRDLLLESLSVHFDTTYVLGDILFYNGPAKYIINDYVAYFNDVFPTFSPFYKHRRGQTPDLTVAMEYDNNFPRAKRGARNRSKRASYTFTARSGDEHLDKSLIFDSGSAFTLSVQHLLDTPRLRYEFDILQAGHYNTTFSYYQSLRRFTSTQSLNFDDSSSHSSFRMIGPITVLEVIRGINPFVLYIPRLSLVRELISGYNMEYDLRRLREVSVSVNVQLEYTNLPSLLGLFYLLQYPTDTAGFESIRATTVPSATTKTICSALYRNRYARIPILFVLQNQDQINTLRDMFVIHVRTTINFTSWKMYSPILLTDGLSLIPSGAYTICLSKTKSHTTKTFLFGDPSSDLGEDALFFDACDLASIHVTYDTHMEELLENQFLPDRVKSLLSRSQGTTYAMPSGGLYDPILSELISKVEPSHHRELELGIRGAEDEGSEIRAGVGAKCPDCKTGVDAQPISLRLSSHAPAYVLDGFLARKNGLMTYN